MYPQLAGRADHHLGPRYLKRTRRRPLCESLAHRATALDLIRSIECGEDQRHVQSTASLKQAQPGRLIGLVGTSIYNHGRLLLSSIQGRQASC
jgi:hypothetical protein